MLTKDKCKIIKKYLTSRFEGNKFSVTKGEGTASHWIIIRVPEAMRNTFSYTDFKSMAVQALKEKNTEADTYSSDDGFDTERYCVSIHFRSEFNK